MKKILLLNGAKKFAHSDGRYNLTMHDTALAFFDRHGFEVKVTHIDEGYDVAEEVEKYLWADVGNFDFKAMAIKVMVMMSPMRYALRSLYRFCSKPADRKSVV